MALGVSLYKMAENKPLRPDLDNTSVGNEIMTYNISLFILLLSTSLVANNISGTVIDSVNQKPISDVNIITKDSGTATDANGEFKLHTKSKYITVEHIGYQKKKVMVDDYLFILMVPKVIKKNEIIVLSGLQSDTLINSVSSISIFTERNIKLSGYNHFQNLIDFSPNLNWAGGTSRPRYFQIRGVGERSQYFGEGSPNFSVSFTLDDIDLSGIGMVGFLNDISQLEISKGPQSTIYGSNAIGGAITLKSNDPSQDFQLKLTNSYGSDNLIIYGLITNIKLYEGAYLRLNAFKNYQDGYRKNIFFDYTDTNKRDESFFRLKLKLVPNQKLSFINTLILSDMKNGYDAWAPDNNEEFKTFTDQPGKDSQKTAAFSIKASLNNDGWDLVSIFSQSNSDLVHSYDGDWGNNMFWEDTSTYGFDPYYYGYYSPYQFFDQNVRNRKTSTSEIRIMSERAVVGFYNKSLKEIDKAEGWLFGGEAAEAESSHNILLNAIYGQYNFNMARDISNTTSLRYENNRVDFNGRSSGYGGEILPEVVSRNKYDLIGYKSSIKYRFNKLSKAYFSISKGYKSGGVNQQPYISDQNRNYSPEYVTNYEMGYKKINQKSLFSISSFYGIRSNQQVSVSAQQVKNDPNSFHYFTANSGSGWMSGLEFEHRLNVTQYISLNYSIGLLDTWVDAFSYQISDDLLETSGGRQASMSPKMSVSSSLTYENEGYFARLSHSHKGKYYFSDSHNNEANAYSLYNLSFGKMLNKISLSFWINNLFDERYPVRGFYFGLIPPYYEDQLWLSYGDPFQASFSIDYSY